MTHFFTGIFRLCDILTDSKEGVELKKALNPHFGKILKGNTSQFAYLEKFNLKFIVCNLW